MNPALIATYRAILVICLVGLAISTLEFLTIARAFAVDGVYSWRILRMRFVGGREVVVARLLDPIGGVGGVRALLVVRLLLVLGLLATPPGAPPFWGLMVALVAANAAFTMRRAIGDDGSDQMGAIVLVTVALCFGPYRDDFILRCGLWFLGLQAALSYATAGIAKWSSPAWRSGDAIFGVFNTCTYGNEFAAAVVRDRRRLRLVLCWSVILVESLFPLCLFLPPPFLWFFLAAAASFHLGCAVIMGLNSFLFAFCATFPAVYHVSSAINAALYAR